MSTFDSTKVALPDMIRDITAGKVQLPDFQRGWVWDDSHVRSLLVSVARSFPVGAVMLLDTGGEVRFQVRPIENVDFPSGIPEPEADPRRPTAPDLADPGVGAEQAGKDLR